MTQSSNLTDDLAIRIYQSLLDGAGDAVHLRDFGRFQPFFCLPLVLETFEDRMVAETPEDLRRAFDSIVGGFDTLGVARMERTCSMAQFSGKTMIYGVHTTRLLSAKGSLIDSYHGLGTLRLETGQWRVASSQYAEPRTSLPSRILHAYTPSSDRAKAGE